MCQQIFAFLYILLYISQNIQSTHPITLFIFLKKRSIVSFLRGKKDRPDLVLSFSYGIYPLTCDPTDCLPGTG